MKVKYQKSNGNDCVVRALSNLTKIKPEQITKELKLTDKGIKTNDWIDWALKKGYTSYDSKKKVDVTIKQISDLSKQFKGGMVARLVNPSKKNQGGHTVFVKNGVFHDDVREVDDNATFRMTNIIVKE